MTQRTMSVSLTTPPSHNRCCADRLVCHAYRIMGAFWSMLCSTLCCFMRDVLPTFSMPVGHAYSVGFHQCVLSVSYYNALFSPSEKAAVDPASVGVPSFWVCALSCTRYALQVVIVPSTTTLRRVC